MTSNIDTSRDKVPIKTDTDYKSSGESMRALTFHAKEDVRVKTVDRPAVTQPKDLVIRVTGATVCGSDLHLFHNEIPELQKRDILGHEGVGVVEEVGPEVSKFKKGDRVLAAFSVGCGECKFCKMDLYTACDQTNPSANMERLYGQKISGIVGYSHLLGGYAGTQAEYFRVPFADVNCFKIPDSVSDEKAILLTDISATAYHSVVDIKFQQGETAAIWGAGPIGQLIAQWCLKVFKAKKVVLIDNVQSRLDWAKEKLGVETINFDEVGKSGLLKGMATSGVVEELIKMMPDGVDVAFDAAGFRYAKSMVHKAMRAMALETDTSETLNEAIRAVRKFGRISVVADYLGLCNGFMIGALMEKGIMLKGNGQAPTQRYMEKILSEYIVTNVFDPTLVLTHRFDFEDLPKAYKAFDEKRLDGDKPYLKAFIQTRHSGPKAKGTPDLTAVPGESQPIEVSMI